MTRGGSHVKETGHGPPQADVLWRQPSGFGRRRSETLGYSEANHLVVKLIAEGAAPIILVNAFVACAFNWPHRLAVSVKPINNGTAGESKGDPIVSRH